MEAEVFTREGVRKVNLNRRKAIHLKCMDCSAFQYKEMINCLQTDCPLHPFRTGIGKQNPVQRNRAIKEYCLWCMYDHSREIEKCTSVNCPLFNYKGFLLQKQHIGATSGTISSELMKGINQGVNNARTKEYK